MTASTRERKERFIMSFGERAARDAVLSLFHRYGLGMLSDEMLDEAASQMVADARRANRNTIRNRNITKRALSAPSEAA